MKAKTLMACFYTELSRYDYTMYVFCAQIIDDVHDKALIFSVTKTDAFGLL